MAVRPSETQISLADQIAMRLFVQQHVQVRLSIIDAAALVYLADHEIAKFSSAILADAFKPLRGFHRERAISLAKLVASTESLIGDPLRVQSLARLRQMGVMNVGAARQRAEPCPIAREACHGVLAFRSLPPQPCSHAQASLALPARNFHEDRGGSVQLRLDCVEPLFDVAVVDHLSTGKHFADTL